MTTTCTNTACIPTKTPGYSIATSSRIIAGMFKTQAQRRALARLDTARLEDLGLSFDQVTCEMDRPFWDVPAHWKL